MARNSDGKRNEETDEFRGLTITNLLLVMAFIMPIGSVIEELRRAQSGFLHYFIGLSTTVASAVIMVVIEWHLLRLIWMQSDKCVAKWGEAPAGVLALLVLGSGVVAGAVIGDAIAGFLIQHIRHAGP